MPIPTPINKLLVSIEAEFVDKITTDSGFTLYLDPTYEKNYNVTSVGTVVSVSQYHKPEYDSVASKLSPNDKIAFSYKVVSDFTFASDKAQFMDVSGHDNPFVKKYTNPQGEWLLIRAIPKAIGKLWVGVYQNKKLEVIDGMQGTESDLNRWLAQFSMGKTDRYVFNNLVDIDGESYWKCNYPEIFAKKVGDEWEAIGDRVMLKPIEIDYTDQIRKLNNIELPDNMVKARFYDRAEVYSGGEDLGLKKGDVVSFEEKYLEKYNFEEQAFFLIKKRRINGLWKYGK